MKGRHLAHILSLLLLSVFFLFSNCVDSTQFSELIISYLDVGQGDSTFIQLPNGETILIDAGNKGDGSDIIGYIQGTGTDTLDYVIATHPHADHIGSMAEVISAFNVKNVYMPKKEHTSKAFENLLDTIEEKGLVIQTAKAGKTVFDDGNLKAEFLAPNSEEYADLNNYSAVLQLTYNDKHFLFMGDAEREVEKEILAREYDVSADVLKVGHHGSDSSSTKHFIETVKPSYAIISVGTNNQYGHPDSATLDILQNVHAAIWRTDERGTIVVVCDGKSITISQIKASIQQPNAPPDSSTVNDQNTTVYITKSGTKYHKDGCRFLDKSRIPVVLSDLDHKIYAPCSVCKPPEQSEVEHENND